MPRHRLTDDQWDAIQDVFPPILGEKIMRAIVFFACLSIITTAVRAGAVQPLTPGNLLTTMRTSTDPFIFELTLQGEIVQSIEVPRPPDAMYLPSPEALFVDHDGSIYVMLNYRQIETHTRVLSIGIWDPSATTWSFRQLIDVFDDTYAFVSDLAPIGDDKIAVLANSAQALLLDRGSLSDEGRPIPAGKCATFAPDGTYYVGGDGRLSRDSICVYDSHSFTEIRRLETNSIEPAAIAVDNDNNIFVARYATLVRIDPEGTQTQLVVSTSWSGDAIYDLELLPNGTIAIGTRSGRLFTVDSDLREESLFASETEDFARWIAWIPKPFEPPVLANTPGTPDEAVPPEPFTAAVEAPHEDAPQGEQPSPAATGWLLPLLGIVTLVAAASAIAFLAARYRK